MTRRYDLIVFDFDGTLADSLTWFRTELDDVIKAHGLTPLSADAAERLRGLPPKAIMGELGIPAWKLPFIAADVRKRAAANTGKIALFDGISAMLEDIQKAGLKIAVVSSNGEDAVRTVLGQDNTARIARFACGAALFGKAQVFRKTMKRLDVEPGRTLCVGDEVRDLEAAHDAGCHAAAVSWGFATRDILAAGKPEHMLDEVCQLAACIAPEPVAASA